MESDSAEIELKRASRWLIALATVVPLMERRRIHRVEKLLDSIDENFDSMKWSLPRSQVENSIKPS
jgi:hypothetical protein